MRQRPGGMRPAVRFCPVSGQNFLTRVLARRAVSDGPCPGERDEAGWAQERVSPSRSVSGENAAHSTVAVKTSSIFIPVRQPGAGSVFWRESVQIGWATPPYDATPS